MSNCFTFSPLKGFTDGIQLAIGVPTARNDGSTYQPHLRIGSEFIQADTAKQPVRSGELLLSAKMRKVETAQNSFQVFSRLDDADTLLVYVDIETPQGLRRRVDVSVLNAWVSFETDAHVVLRQNGSGKCLAEFTKDEQAMLIFDRDGAVYRIVRRNGAMMVDHLTPAEMAKERLSLLRTQVREIDLSSGDAAMKRFHGILGGAVRLLPTAVRNPATRELFVDFLADFADGRMGIGMRKEVHSILRAYGDSRAFMFAEGYDGNVISFVEHRAKGLPADARARKAQRSAADAALRSKMRGSSNGGGGKKQARG